MNQSQRAVAQHLQEIRWDTAVDTSAPVVVLVPGFYDTGHGIARSLGRLGARVYGVHVNPRSPTARSRYWTRTYSWPIHSARATESVEWLLQLSREIGSRPILIPTDDGGCLFVSEHAAALREGFRYPTQPPGLALSLSSKEQMYHLCRRHGIPTAQTHCPKSRDEVLEFLDTGPSFPMMLKPIENRAGRRAPNVHMRVVSSPAMLLRQYDAMETPGAPNLMLQEYIPGGPEAVWMFNGYFDEGSRCLFGITGKKLRQYPAYTGMTSLGICVENETVRRQAIGLMQAVQYRGVLDIGFKYDARTGTYKLLDVNPRVGATFRLFVDTVGMDVVRALYLDLTGQHVSTGAIREGRKWVVENYDLASSLRYMRDGRLGVAEWARSFRDVEESSWFAWDDLGPFRRMVWFSIAKGLAQVTDRDAG